VSIKEQRGNNFLRPWVMQHWDLINRLAERRYRDQLLAEEAALYVIDMLEKDDWKILRNFRGGARLQTYFSTVVYNLLEDFSRKRFGRVRPPPWLKKLGGVWLMLYQLLCLQRLSYLEATGQAADRYQHLPSDQIENIADRILGQIPSCGSPQYLQESLENHEQHSAPHGSAEKAAEEKEREVLFACLHDQFFGAPPGRSTGRLVSSLADCRIELSGEERLLLKLRHMEGLSVSEAGKKLGLNRFQAHGKLRRLYQRIRQAFDGAGQGEALRLMLAGDPDTK
jgi:DNA-directed RNA polymerase specialized sigma24 family protein